MEKLITVSDVVNRYGCSRQTARKYIRECDPHMEKPLVTFDWALRNWEDSRLVSTTKTTTRITAEGIFMNTERVIVPRRR